MSPPPTVQRQEALDELQAATRLLLEAPTRAESRMAARAALAKIESLPRGRLAGRPSRAAARRRIALAYRAGCPVANLAATEGVPVATIHRWLWQEGVRRAPPAYHCAAALAAARAAAGLSQAEVARQLGVTRQCVHRWETVGRMTRPTIERLAAVVGVSPEHLIDPEPLAERTNV